MIYRSPLYHRFKSRTNLCQGETTSFFETHTMIDYGFCQDSGPDLSVLSFVMTFTTMSSVISSGFCYLSPKFPLGILDLSSCVKTEQKTLLRVSTFPMSDVILPKQISRYLRIHLQPVSYLFEPFLACLIFLVVLFLTFLQESQFALILAFLVLIPLIRFHLNHSLIQGCFSLLKRHSKMIWDKKIMFDIRLNY